MDKAVMQQYRQRLMRLGRRPTANTPFLSNAIVHWISVGVVAIIIAVFVIVFLQFEPTATKIKLQYNIYFGANVLGQWWSPYVLIAVGALFYMIDIVLAFLLYGARQRIAAYAVLLGGLFAHVALLIAVISIVVNN